VRIALDTSVLAYAEDVRRAPGDGAKVATIRALIGRLPTALLIVPTQALGELFVVLVRRAAMAPEAARAVVLALRDAWSVQQTDEATLAAALDLAVRHRLQFWDSVILSAAAEAGCRWLLSEDMQPGFTHRGVTVVDPFAPLPDALAATLQG
jgi:predicted nucleic acid-binding protein